MNPSRQQLIEMAQKKNPRITMDAMIVGGEWGWWVGATVYISAKSLIQRPTPTKQP